MGFYEELELNKIFVLLQELKARCEALYLICNEGGERIGVMNPDEMNSVIQHIFRIYTECADKLRFIDSILGSFPLSYISEDNQELLHNQIASFLDSIGCIPNLVHIFGDAFEVYSVSGASGNPADISGIIWWQRRFCENGAALISNCEKMILSLIDLKQKEELAITTCVYASPELMRNNAYSIAETDVYPFIHASLFDDENNAVREVNEFEDKIMEEIYDSSEIIREYAGVINCKKEKNDNV